MQHAATELFELLKTRLPGILMKEASNTESVYLYLTDGYWMAFERSAYRLCTLFSEAIQLPMKVATVPFPIVAAGVPCSSASAVLGRLTCVAHSSVERIYKVAQPWGEVAYCRWHKRMTCGVARPRRSVAAGVGEKTKITKI